MQGEQEFQPEHHVVGAGHATLRKAHEVVEAGGENRDKRAKGPRAESLGNRRPERAPLGWFEHGSGRPDNESGVQKATENERAASDVETAREKVEGVHDKQKGPRRALRITFVIIPAMIHEVLPVGALQCNCSIFGDPESGEAIVIDPGDEIEQIEAIVAKHGLRVVSIVITHAHIDHIGGAAKLRKSTGAPVYMNENDEELRRMLDVQAGWLGTAAPEAPDIEASLTDGDVVQAGDLGFDVIYTPGHTQGSVCLHLSGANLLVAGDTLFRDSIGRTDLPGGDTASILRSIHGKLLALPEETRVICGHGPETTIGREKEHNPFLQDR